MRSSKITPLRPRRRVNRQKRSHSPSWVPLLTPWHLTAFLRRFRANRFSRIGGISTLLFLCALLLWWADYPQRMGRWVSHGFIAASGRMGLALQDVLVEGRHNTPLDKILKVVNGRRGEPILNYNPYRIKKSLEEISWIRQATVQRQLPGILFIQLIERRPVAIWQRLQKYYLIDGEGVIISTDGLHAFAKLPLVVGEDAPLHAPEILKMLENFPEINTQVTALARVGGRRWDLHLNKTVVIKLPEIKIEAGLKHFSGLIAHKKINLLETAVVDLRIPGKTIVRLLPAANLKLKDKGKET